MCHVLRRHSKIEAVNSSIPSRRFVLNDACSAFSKVVCWMMLVPMSLSTEKDKELVGI
jgi:hypothetical protein